MASPEQHRPRQPAPAPPFAAQNPAAQGPPGAGALPGAFANLQISRGAAPPPGAPPRGLTPQQAPPAFSAARPGPPPPAAAAAAVRSAFPGSPPAPPFVRAPTASAAPSAASPFGGPPGSMSQAPPPFGGHPGAASQQPPLFSGPPGAASRVLPPFGGPPSAASQAPPPFGGPPAVVSQASPLLGGPPAATSQGPPPFGGPSFVASQVPLFGGSRGAGSQPPLFGGPPAVASQPAPPMFGGQRPAFPGQHGLTAASSQPVPPSFGPPQQPPPPFGGQTQFGGPRSSGQPPFAAQSAPVAQQPSFMGPPRANAPAFGPPSWQTQGAGSGAMQPPMGMPGIPGMQPNTLGPTGTPAIPYSPHAGTQVSTPSKIDPTQIPRPMTEASVIIYDTRQGGQATVPPAASSEFIVKDTGNCSPRLMRCTVNQIPCTGDLLTTSGMPLALMVQPFALPHPSEEPIQLVDFGEMGPIRCSRCKAYINPFMRFVDQGRHFVCNLCGFRNDTPRDYMCNLGPDGRRRDADDRPELCRGTVEFVATKEFLTGATAAACSAIAQAISDLPEGPRTMVGIATFDSVIHFYSLKRAQQQPLMLIVPDVHDVYTPLQTDLILPVSECQENLEQLLESIPNMFENNRVADSAFGAAMKAGFLAIKSTGGKLLVFQSVLPSLGVGSLSAREAEGRANVTTGDKEAHKLLQPVDNTLKTMALEFAEYQVCVDVFLTTQSYVDIASISVVPQTTGGRVYYYYPFSALSDPAKLFNDLRWNISRPQGFEAVMRVRCSQGLQVQDYFGNFCKRVPTDIDLPAIDSDKTVMVTFKHDDKLQENAECGFQCALLYTTVYGQRRIRVINLSLSCTSLLSDLFRYADLETQFACFLKQAANGIPTSPLPRIRDEATNTCINILQSYRKHCASVTSSGQLILPEALKLLPLYTLALVKSVGLRTDGCLDERSYWMSIVSSISVVLAVPLVFPRLIPIHDLTSRADDDTLIPSSLMLSSENVQEDGVYLLENGEDGLIYVGNMVNPATLEQIFGVSSLAALPVQLVLEQFDNELSRKVNEVVNEIRRQRCSYLRLRLCRRGEPSGDFFRSFLLEDKAPGVFSYVEFLVHVHRQIQSKMT
ncbi:protein transport protein Sec24-like At4g32640 isoform X2 [Panicum virgatum]|uniref:protein transport protein Sec24-like At4g32640 isoform X2 n=1 Tax=Panicum virgatum TaxID=38727 RepID=UPI0019D603AE|nr:protein transport protein Sec24-like At4g32640 isoform X2 [Panicum virgatum]